MARRFSALAKSIFTQTCYLSHLNTTCLHSFTSIRGHNYCNYFNERTLIIIAVSFFGSTISFIFEDFGAPGSDEISICFF